MKTAIEIGETADRIRLFFLSYQGENKKQNKKREWDLPFHVLGFYLLKNHANLRVPSTVCLKAFQGWEELLSLLHYKGKFGCNESYCGLPRRVLHLLCPLWGPLMRSFWMLPGRVFLLMLKLNKHLSDFLHHEFCRERTGGFLPCFSMCLHLTNYLNIHKIN